MTSSTGFLGGSVVKNPPADAGDMGLIPLSGPERYPGEGNGNSLQYSCLKNPMGRAAWQAAYSLWGRKELDMTEQLSALHTHTHTNISDE